ncbi:hypothetical protein FRB90_010699 [Tulasnella sp. 427]|nr:hypothetical protein FRB90_010699 [Tulasnella sp. 427]
MRGADWANIPHLFQDELPAGAGDRIWEEMQANGVGKHLRKEDYISSGGGPRTLLDYEELEELRRMVEEIIGDQRFDEGLDLVRSVDVHVLLHETFGGKRLLDMDITNLPQGVLELLRQNLQKSVRQQAGDEDDDTDDEKGLRSADEDEPDSQQSVQANMTEQPIKQEVHAEFKRPPPQPTARLLTPPSDSPSPTERASIKASKRSLENHVRMVENMDPPTSGAATQSSKRSTNFMFTIINPDSASAPLSPLHSGTEPAVPLAISAPPQPSLFTRQTAPPRNVTLATGPGTTIGSVILEGGIGISLRATEDDDKERQSKRRKVLDVMIPPSRRSPLATRKLGPTSRSPVSPTVQSRSPSRGAPPLINFIPSIIPVPAEDPISSDCRERKAHRRAQKELERKLSAQLEVANPTYFRPCERHVLDHGQGKAMERDLKRARDGAKEVKTESPEV